ncbi:MAG: SulP family inorganic anion transporter [Casimicrobiaceae bacterium]
MGDHARRAASVDGVTMDSAGSPPARPRDTWIDVARTGARDAVGGLVSAVVLVANIVSFAALMFPGELAAGIPIAIWAMLVGSALGGLWIAWTTSLPPIATGIDSPTGAVLVLLSASASAAVTGSGGSAQTAVVTVMLLFTAATLMSGALLYVIGLFRWGAYFRFVPYFVVGGFLAATGWFLVAGGVRMTTGWQLGFDGGFTHMSAASVERLASAVMVMLALLGARRFIKSTLALPASLVVMWIAGVVLLHALGLSGREHGWYLPSLGTLSPWSPLEAARTTHLTWRTVLELTPEFVAVAIVALVSLVTKVASLEVARQTSGDLDREFRAHGLSNMAIAPLGGIACSLQTGTSRLLEQAGSGSRMGGAASAVILGAVAFAHLDLPGAIPLPIVAGLVLYLGYTFVVDALARPWTQRAWMDLLLAIVIMAVCVRHGYLVGVLAGLIGACVLFAASYARLGVVRRHATRAEFAGFVDRSTEASAYLRAMGNAVQIYWLSGYIFFGSSEGLFERVRARVESLPPGDVRYVILDLAVVTGIDSSAVASLTKLRNFCDRQEVTLLYCSLSRVHQAVLELGALIGGKRRHRAFIDLNHALAWCEDHLLAAANLSVGMDMERFEAWLQHQIGNSVRVIDLMAYLERKETADSEVLYREGEPADTIDLVAVGNLAIDVPTRDGQYLRVRRFMTHTMLGEMGFARRTPRSATVRSTGQATVFTLTRANFERMRDERPDLASAFDAFVIRTLADRIDLANRTAAALGG